MPISIEEWQQVTRMRPRTHNRILIIGETYEMALSLFNEVVRMTPDAEANVRMPGIDATIGNTRYIIVGQHDFHKCYDVVVDSVEFVGNVTDEVKNLAITRTR